MTKWNAPKQQEDQRQFERECFDGLSDTLLCDGDGVILVIRFKRTFSAKYMSEARFFVIRDSEEGKFSCHLDVFNP